MTFEEKGAYMELLMMQFNRGHMTSHMIGQVIGQLWVNIQDKFTQDENGLWYNQRLEEEKNKRQKFTESRRNNISGSNQHTKKSNKKRGHKTGHMTSHMEDVNENEDESIIVVYPFDSENFKKWWSIWKEYKKKEHRFNYKTKISEQAALKKLSHLSGGNELKAAAIIEQSISEGWKGFFELKQSRESTQKSYENLKRKFREEAENQK